MRKRNDGWWRVNPRSRGFGHAARLGLAVTLLTVCSGVASADTRSLRLHVTGKADIDELSDEQRKAVAASSTFPYGFRLTSQRDIEDSVKDLRGKLKGQDAIVQAATPDEADLLVEVLGRASRRVGDGMGIRMDTRMLVRLAPGPRLDPLRIHGSGMNWEGSFTVRVEVRHHYTSEAPYWDLEISSMGNWGAHAKGVVKALNRFVKNNSEALVTSRTDGVAQ